MNNKILASLLLCLVSSCSLAPFAPSHTGRSLGQGQAQSEFGSANSNYYLSAAAGLSQNLDLGYIMQFGGDFSTSAVTAKYSLANNASGPAFALEGGYGAGESSSFYYVGAIGSLAFNDSFELFLNARLNKANADDTEVDIGDYVGNMKVTAEDLTYVLATGGFNVWATQSFGISVFGTQGFGENIEWKDGLAIGASILMRL